MTSSVILKNGKYVVRHDVYDTVINLYRYGWLITDIAKALAPLPTSIVKKIVNRDNRVISSNT